MNTKNVAPKELIENFCENWDKEDEVFQIIKQLKEYNLSPYYEELSELYRNIFYLDFAHTNKMATEIKNLFLINFSTDILFQDSPLYNPQTNNEFFYKEVVLNEYYLLDRVDYNKEVLDRYLPHVELSLQNIFDKPNESIKLFNDYTNKWVVCAKSPNEDKVKYIKEGMENLLIHLFEICNKDQNTGVKQYNFTKFEEYYSMSVLNAKLKDVTQNSCLDNNSKYKL